MINTPEDIKQSWFKPIRRLQALASQNKGVAIITINIMVDKDGEPVLWTEPILKKIEPRKISPQEILSIFNDM